jgi:hypothetical protein
MGFSPSFSDPYYSGGPPTSAIANIQIGAPAGLVVVAVGTVIHPNPRLDEKAAMAERTRTIHRRLVEWEELSDDQSHTVRIQDADSGQELAGGTGDDAVDAILDLMPFIVPPGSKGL